MLLAIAVQVLAVWTSLVSARILALVDNESDYSQYFDSIRHRGLELDVYEIRSEAWQLVQDQGSKYDQLIILPSKVKSLGSRLSNSRLLEFFNSGGDIIAVTNERSVPDSIRQFASELDVHISPRGYKVADNFDAEFRKYGTVKAEIVAPQIVDSTSSLSVQGSAAYLGSNPLVFPIIKADSNTCYVYDARDQDELSVGSDALWASGSQVVYAAGLESRHSHSRFVWMGSDAEFIKDSAIAESVTSWALQERNVLRVTSVSHFKLDDSETTTIVNPSIYKVGDHARYEIVVQQGGRARSSSQQSTTGGLWKAYDADDIQLEFVMLDPYYRLNLHKDTAKSTSEYSVYFAEFQVPDQHGMFTFKVNYARPGYTLINEAHTVTVRHTANDEWPRSWEISNSWVYLTSAVCTVVSFGVFVILYMYSGTGAPAETKTK